MFSEDGKWLTQRNGRFFFLGFRMPWVPRFILKRYGYKSTKSVNNNFLTSLDWTIPTNEFQMPYNLPMQTLSFVVFAVLIVKMSLAVGWLVYFMLYGNENSSRIYVQPVDYRDVVPSYIILYCLLLSFEQDNIYVYTTYFAFCCNCQPVAHRDLYLQGGMVFPV